MPDKRRNIKEKKRAQRREARVSSAGAASDDVGESSAGAAFVGATYDVPGEVQSPIPKITRTNFEFTTPTSSGLYAYYFLNMTIYKTQIDKGFCLHFYN